PPACSHLAAGQRPATRTGPCPRNPARALFRAWKAAALSLGRRAPEGDGPNRAPVVPAGTRCTLDGLHAFPRERRGSSARRRQDVEAEQRVVDVGDLARDEP